jgi:hypothetical protein
VPVGRLTRSGWKAHTRSIDMVNHATLPTILQPNLVVWGLVAGLAGVGADLGEDRTEVPLVCRRSKVSHFPDPSVGSRIRIFLTVSNSATPSTIPGCTSYPDVLYLSPRW